MILAINMTEKRKLTGLFSDSILEAQKENCGVEKQSILYMMWRKSTKQGKKKRRKRHDGKRPEISVGNT